MPALPEPEFHVFPDAESLAAAAAAAVAEVIRDRVGGGDRPVVSLTGGSVGVRTAAALRDAAVPWEQVVIHFGDERFVAVDDPERNDGQIDEALLDHLDSPPTIVRWPARTDLASDVDAAAANYLDALDVPEGDAPIFDVHLLGMGPEGHVDSLFPHAPATAEDETLVVGVRDCPKPPPERMTYTLPAVRRSRHVLFVVAGRDKAEAVARAAADEPAIDLPAAGARGIESTRWFLDEEAASRLSRDRRG